MSGLDDTSTPAYGSRVEYAATRKVRERNTITYRILHWPVWAWVYFLLPGPLIAGLFHRGLDAWVVTWLACVLAGTGAAAFLGKLPGTETRPYVMFFTEDKPNPVYRRFCYTMAWGVIAAYPAVNITGLLVAILSGRWMMHQLYAVLFVPVMCAMWLLGALGKLPRTKPSVQYRGIRAPRVLRCGVDGNAGADRAVGPLEGAAPGRRRGRGDADSVRRPHGLHRVAGLPRLSSAHASDRAWRADHDRLALHLHGQRGGHRRVVPDIHRLRREGERGARGLHDAHDTHQQLFLHTEEGREVRRIDVREHFDVE